MDWDKGREYSGEDNLPDLTGNGKREMGNAVGAEKRFPFPLSRFP
jgi:hypothetical protein